MNQSTFYYLLRRGAFRGKGSSFVGLLDLFPNAEAAYSLRRLTKEYNGALIMARNKVTQDLADIGFDGDGNLDMVALAALANIDGTTRQVSVVTIYDQSGKSRDLSQPLAALQPNIYLGTGPILDGGKPAMLFDGDDDFLVNTNGLTTADSHLISAVHNIDDASILSHYVFSLGYNDSDSITLRISNGLSQYWLDGLTSQLTGAASVGTARRITIGQQSGGTQSAYDNGELGQSVSYNYLSGAVPDITLGWAYTRNGGGVVYKGTIQEAIYWGADQAANRSAIELNTNDFYSIY